MAVFIEAIEKVREMAATLILIVGVAYVCYRFWKDGKEKREQEGNELPKGELTFEHPSNGFQESFDYPWLWTLLFGPFYFALKRIWVHTFISGVVAIMTFGASWLVYPFFSRQIIVNHYLRSGWKLVQDEAVSRSL